MDKQLTIIAKLYLYCLSLTSNYQLTKNQGLEKLHLLLLLLLSEAVIRRCSSKQLVLKLLLYSQENTPVLESLFNKVASLKACNFIKKRLQHRCFPVNIARFLRTALQNISGGWLCRFAFHVILVFRINNAKSLIMLSYSYPLCIKVLCYLQSEKI